MKSIVRHIYENKQIQSTINDVQSQTSFMTIGYFYLNENITEIQSLITIGEQEDFYNLFNLLLIDDQSIQLKYIDNVNNAIYKIDSNITSILNTWIGFGIVYSKSVSKVKFVLTNSNSQLVSSQVISNVKIPSRILKLDVCISCIIQGGIFGNFKGKFSTVKIIYNVDFNLVSSYYFFNEATEIDKAIILNEIFDQNKYVPYNEYDIGQGFNCNLGFAFVEGVCIQQNKCSSLSEESDQYEAVEIGKYYDKASKKCALCSINCLKCDDKQKCTSCRPGYLLYTGYCFECNSGNNCNIICTNQQVFDPMNQICIEKFNTILHSLYSPLLSNRIIINSLYNELNIIPSNSLENQMVHCYIDSQNNPITLHSFLGGNHFTAQTIIMKTWTKIPQGYQKSVSFYVIFFQNGNPSNLQIRINQKLADIVSSEIVSNQTQCSGSVNQLYQIFRVVFIVKDYLDIFSLEIKSTTNNWGVRNINIEIFKCHPTCNSCFEGGSITDCTTCAQGFIKNNFQCTIQKGQYARYLNCFSSQCAICTTCQILYCLKCEDITGNCTKCKQGYLILDGICIREQQCSSVIDLKFQGYCGIQQDVGLSQFQNNKIVQYGDYWKFDQDQVYAVSCVNLKCLPIIGRKQKHSLEINLQNYYSYHFQLNFTLTVFAKGSLDTDTDLLTFQDGSKVIASECYSKYKSLNQISGGPGASFNYNDTFEYIKADNKLFLQIISKSNEPEYNEGYSFTNINFNYNRCNPCCKICGTLGIKTCKTCIDNAISVSGICQCKSGFFFQLVRFPSENEFPGICNPCNPSCKTCNGPSYRDCILCQDGYTNVDQICQYNCLDGQYWDKVSQTCKKCHICCRTCAASQNNICHDCLQGFMFNVLDRSCMIYNVKCQTCTVALNSLCGGNQNSNDTCKKNNWVNANSSLCVNCGSYQNDDCGGYQGLEVVEICNKYGFYTYDGLNCSSCRQAVANRCGIQELQDTCQNNGWIVKDQNTCVHCGKFINGACGGDFTQEEIQFCILKGFINYDNVNCFSCMNVISHNCGGNQIKDECYASGWKIYDSMTCFNCLFLENQQCGIQSTSDIVNNCKIDGFINYDQKRCSSCKDVIKGSCGRDEIKLRCFDQGWDQKDSQSCINCNISSPTFNLCLCHDTCLSCSRYFNPNTCTSCQPSLYLFYGQCLTKCPNGYIINGQNCLPCTEKQIPTCFNCYKTCSICNPFEVSSNSNTCTSCSSNTRILFNGECKCKDLEDGRQNFYECSYQTLAVLEAVLSNKYPALTIDLGKQISIPNQFIPEQYSPSLCSYLFASQTLDMLGSDCECQISKKLILVKLGNDSLIFDGDIINLNLNVIGFMSSPDIMISKYMNNMVQQEKLIGDAIVKFNLESPLNSCEDISITFNQIINDAQRGFKNFSWSLISFEPQDTIFQPILNNKLKQLNRDSGLNLIIQKGIIKPGVQVLIQFDYILKVNIKGDLQFPISVIVQKKIIIEVQNSFLNPFYRHKNALIVVSTIMKICNVDGDQIFQDPIKLSVSSVQIPSIENIISTQSNFYHNLEFKPYDLQIGPNILKIQSNLEQDPNIQSQIDYKLQVDSSKIYVKILGGDGYFNYKNNIDLKSFVRDYDLPTQNIPQNINIKWKCIEQVTQMPCLNRQKKLIVFLENQEMVTILGYTFEPYTVIKMVLIGEKQVNRKSIDEISILLSELDLPQLKVSLSMQDPKQETVNQNEEIYVDVDYSGSFNTDLLSYSGVIQYKNQVVAVIKFDYSKFRFVIQNYFSDFNRDQSKFQLRLSVFNPQYTMPSISTIQLTLNFPPNNCKFTVIPETNIFSYETKVLLMLDECQDQDQPLQYQFFYYQNSEDFEYEKKHPNQVKRKQISDISHNYLQEAIFPTGEIVILAQAIDSKNSIFNTTKTIIVQKKQYDEQSYSSLMQQKIQQSSNIPFGKTISELNVVCDDLLQRPEFDSNPQINKYKVKVMNELHNLQLNISSLSTFSTAANKGIVSILKSGIDQDQVEQKEFLNKVVFLLDSNSELRESSIELSKEKLKQNIYDTFQIVENQLNHEARLDQIQELFSKIGLYSFKNALPNENPFHFEGKNMSIFSQLITQKYACSYLMCKSNTEQIEQKNQTKLYNYTLSTYHKNPYQNDSQFLNCTSQFYPSNKTSPSVYPLISPTINNYLNDQTSTLPNQIILNYPKITQNSVKSKTACISKDDLNKQWTKSNCQSFYNDQSKNYECICSKLSPTTIIDEIEDLFQNSNAETAFTSEGISNLTNFSDFYKYTMFWLLVIQTLGFFSFFSIGRLIDKSDQRLNLKQQNYDKTIQSNNISQISPLKKNKVVSVNQLSDLNEIKFFDQKSISSKNTMASRSNNENIYQSDNDDVLLESHILQSKITSSQSILPNFKVNRQSQAFAKQLKLSRYGQNQQSQICSSKQIKDSENPLNTESKQKEFFLEKNNSSPNSPQQSQSPQRTEEKVKNVFSFFMKLPAYKQILVFHNFFGIFYLYNAYTARSKRFLVFYIRSLHSLAISIIFDQQYSILQRIIIAIINSIIIILIVKILTKMLSYTSMKGVFSSRTLTAIIILGYYYIILAIVSGQSPNESNKFLMTFLMFYICDILVISLISAFLQRIIAITILKKLNKSGMQSYLFKLLELQLILINFDSD